MDHVPNQNVQKQGTDRDGGVRDVDFASPALYAALIMQCVQRKKRHGSMTVPEFVIDRPELIPALVILCLAAR